MRPKTGVAVWESRLNSLARLSKKQEINRELSLAKKSRTIPTEEELVAHFESGPSFKMLDGDFKYEKELFEKLSGELMSDDTFDEQEQRRI